MNGFTGVVALPIPLRGITHVRVDAVSIFRSEIHLQFTPGIVDDGEFVPDADFAQQRRIISSADAFAASLPVDTAYDEELGLLYSIRDILRFVFAAELEARGITPPESEPS